jgi:hypothetical protein
MAKEIVIGQKLCTNCGKKSELKWEKDYIQWVDTIIRYVLDYCPFCKKRQDCLAKLDEPWASMQRNHSDVSSDFIDGSITPSPQKTNSENV